MRPRGLGASLAAVPRPEVLLLTISLLLPIPANVGGIKCRCNQENPPSTWSQGGCNYATGTCELLETPELNREGSVPVCTRENYFDVKKKMKMEKLECSTMAWAVTFQQPILKSAAYARESFCHKVCSCRSSDLCNSNIENQYLAVTGANLVPTAARDVPLKCKCGKFSSNSSSSSSLSSRGQEGCDRPNECDSFIKKPNDVGHVEICAKNAFYADGKFLIESYECQTQSPRSEHHMETCITACFCRDRNYCNDREIVSASPALKPPSEIVIVSLLMAFVVGIK